MRKNSLDLLSRNLANQIAKATDSQKRSICLAVAKRAVRRVQLDNPSIKRALYLLEGGMYRNDLVATTLRQLVDNLDDQYFAAQKLHEADPQENETYLTLFRKARAASAVLFALNEDPFIAATESIYEACAALDSVDDAQSVAADVLQDN